jgi:hypothetical protein
MVHPKQRFRAMENVRFLIMDSGKTFVSRLHPPAKCEKLMILSS